MKISKNLEKHTYSLVPVQSFTGQSDMAWSKAINEIDKQLFKKYGLDQEEREYIEKTIKPII